MVKKKNKLPLWLLLGLIFSLVSLVIEIIIANMEFFVFNLSFIAVPLMELAPLAHFPLMLIEIISPDSILYLSRLYTHPTIIPNIYGSIVVVAFWFGAGALIGHYSDK
ncbi:MAG: hypothetical protein ABIG28_01800 [archaeon]